MVATASYSTGVGGTAFNQTFRGEMENGEAVVGYQYLHGTNKDVGDFNMTGNSTVTRSGNGYEVRIESSYTWNDIIDPNFQYSIDRWKAEVAQIISLGHAKPYQVHITWTEETVVKLDKEGNVISMQGYPA